MNYIEQINLFWTANEEHSFRTTDIALYFYLLKVNNDCSWKEYFKRNNRKIEVDLSISFNTLKDARNRLKNANLINFKTTNGDANVLYNFCTSSKIDKVSNEVRCEVTNEVSTRLVPSKDKLNKTKGKREREETPDNQIPIFDRFKNRLDFPISVCLENVLDNQQYLETIAINNHLGSLDNVISWLNKFFIQLQNEGVEEKSVNDFKSHFGRWLVIKLKEERNADKRKRFDKTGHSALPTEADFLDAIATGIHNANQ